MLSIIIPVYNEEKTLQELLEKVYSLEFSGDRELVVVDDGSTDGSKKIAQKFTEGKKDVKLVSKKNGGKGTAIRAGLENASGEIITIQDADLEYNPEDLVKMYQALIQHGKGTAIYGSRFRRKHNYQWAIPVHYVGNRMLSLFTSILFGSSLTDMETCYKMFYKESLEGVKLKAKHFEIEPELTAALLKRGVKIIEVPISYKPRSANQGKKISWKDGVKAFFYLVKYRFS
ncbi:MAG: glycosyltransferase family 2 protein [Nanoarchaeota archaeon]|nr:glycosyltransferase family 2 protein [Nanoarchaeota archaeon]